MVVRKLWNSQIEAAFWEAIGHCRGLLDCQAMLRPTGRSSSTLAAHNLRTTMDYL
jgi:hypothetical protein